MSEVSGCHDNHGDLTWSLGVNGVTWNFCNRTCRSARSTKIKLSRSDQQTLVKFILRLKVLKYEKKAEMPISHDASLTVQTNRCKLVSQLADGCVMKLPCSEYFLNNNKTLQFYCFIVTLTVVTVTLWLEIPFPLVHCLQTSGALTSESWAKSFKILGYFCISVSDRNVKQRKNRNEWKKDNCQNGTLN